eukprot:TRINITY_DN38275_c0_g1_i2.p1 TRINITY_DN38275_c0_g1~~TRINITY_DN38275_c0_g1_i2.p1  ORF type:complete len:132 (+),score=33.78 TRINITY_DN38275_c0_g1_i2:198-593(+)
MAGSFKEEQRRAIALGVPRKDAVMAADWEDLQALIDAHLGNPVTAEPAPMLPSPVMQPPEMQSALNQDVARVRRGEADSFKQLRKQALALGVSNREVNMAADEADLKNMIAFRKGKFARQGRISSSKCIMR